MSKKKSVLEMVKHNNHRRKKKTNKVRTKSVDVLMDDEPQVKPSASATKKRPAKKKPAVPKQNPLDVPIGNEGRVSGEKKLSRQEEYQRLDWTKLAKMSEREKIRTLKNEYLTMLERNDDLKEQVETQKKGNYEKSITITNLNKDIVTVKSTLRDVVEEIPAAAQLKQRMDTEDWKPEAIADDVIVQIKNVAKRAKFAEDEIGQDLKKAEEKERVLKNKVTEANKTIKDLKERLRESHEENKKLKKTGVVVPHANEENMVEAPESPEEEIEEVAEQVEAPESEEIEEIEELEEVGEISLDDIEEEVEEDAPEYVFIETDGYTKDLTEQAWYIIDVVGRTGVARNKELALEVAKDEKAEELFNVDKNTNEISNVVKLLKDRQVFKTQFVKLGGKGAYDFICFELSEIGKAVYYKRNKKTAVASSQHQIKGPHASLEHGYLIKECVDSMREMGYTVYENSKDCTIKLKDNRRKVFDFVFEERGEKKYVEVERGTHHEEGFYEALDKMYEATTEFYFIAPNKNVIYESVKARIFEWLGERGGFKKFKGKLILNFSTLEHMKQKKKNLWESLPL